MERRKWGVRGLKSFQRRFSENMNGIEIEIMGRKEQEHRKENWKALESRWGCPGFCQM